MSHPSSKHYPKTQNLPISHSVQNKGFNGSEHY